MNRPEFLIAVMFLLIGIAFIYGRIIKFFGAESITQIASNMVSWSIFIFAVITAIMLIKDARKE